MTSDCFIIMFLYYRDVLHIQMPYGGIMDQWNKCVCVCWEGGHVHITI
jgi:hypothetical protein